MPHNDLTLVSSLISALGWEADTNIQLSDNDAPRSLKDVLLYDFEISKLTPALLHNAAELFGNPMLNANVGLYMVEM